MLLDKVQDWALVKFGRYSHDYAQVVAVVHQAEEALGQLMRLAERHGVGVELGEVSAAYSARLRHNPQERIP